MAVKVVLLRRLHLDCRQKAAAIGPGGALAGIDKAKGAAARRYGAETELSEAKYFVSRTLKMALFHYRLQMGDYPSTSDGLNALIQPPKLKTEQWKGPYLQSKGALIDPWGNLYQYRYPSERRNGGYDAWSFGPDGIASKDDIKNWE